MAGCALALTSRLSGRVAETPCVLADEEIAEALANGEEVIPLNMEPTLVELLDIGVQRLKERPTWKVRSVSETAAMSS